MRRRHLIADEVTLADVVHGQGELRRGGTAVPVSGFVLRRSRDSASGVWDIDAWLGAIDRQLMDALFRPGSEPIALVGRSDSGESVLVERVHLRSAKGNRIEADTTELLSGATELPRIPERQFILLTTTPSRVARAVVDGLVLDWTGEIRSIGQRRPRRPLRWRSTAGVAQLTRRFHYVETTVESSDALLRIPKSTVALRVQRGSLTRQPAQLLRQVTDDIADLLTIVGFLERRVIRVVHGFIASRWSDGHREHRGELDWSRAIRVPPSPRTDEPLASSARVDAKVLEAATRALRASKGKDGLVAACLNLNLALSEEVVDRSFISAFLALEAIVAAIASDNAWHQTVRRSSFKRLRGRLKQVVEEFASENGISPQKEDELVRKLPELRRRPIIDQAMTIVAKLDVDLDGIWPLSVEPQDGLQAAHGRRSRYVHNAVLPSVRQAHVDSLRVHAVAERILWRFFQVPDDLLWPRAYDHLTDLDKVEAGAV